MLSPTCTGCSCAPAWPWTISTLTPIHGLMSWFDLGPCGLAQRSGLWAAPLGLACSPCLGLWDCTSCPSVNPWPHSPWCHTRFAISCYRKICRAGGFWFCVECMCGVTETASALQAQCWGAATGKKKKGKQTTTNKKTNTHNKEKQLTL